MTNREYLNTLSIEEFTDTILQKVFALEKENFDFELDIFDITDGVRFDFEKWIEAEYQNENTDMKKCFNGECVHNLENKYFCPNWRSCDNFFESYEKAKNYFERSENNEIS